MPKNYFQVARNCKYSQCMIPWPLVFWCIVVWCFSQKRDISHLDHGIFVGHDPFVDILDTHHFHAYINQCYKPLPCISVSNHRCIPLHVADLYSMVPWSVFMVYPPQGCCLWLLIEFCHRPLLYSPPGEHVCTAMLWSVDPCLMVECLTMLSGTIS